MKNVIQVILVVIFASVLLSAPDAFAIDSCLVCKGIATGEGSFYIYCGQVSGGGMGARYCFIEDDGNGGAYCHTEGDWCCETGPMY